MENHSGLATGIRVAELNKTFRSYRKGVGWRETVRGFFKRDWIERHAVKQVNLTISPGEIVGLVGANGAGKTTLVKCLSGIIPPTSGVVTVNGFVPADRDYAFRHQIALVMGQKAQLWWDLPALDCFELLRQIYTIPRENFERNVRTLSDMLQVGQTTQIPIRRLSLGERMKMEIMAALLHDPKIIFLDEPTIGLDLETQQNIRKFLKSYAAERQPIIILTSHYMEDIASVCSRLLLMSDGELVYDGPLAAVYQQFAQEKVVAVKLDPEAGYSSHDLQSSLAKHLALLGLEQKAAQVVNEVECRCRVPREKVNEVTRHIFERFQVADISIAEDDVSTIIHRMMQEARKPHVAPA